MGLVAELSDAADLSSSLRNQMFALMCVHYENVRRESFDRDLLEKHWVILLRQSGERRLLGFSTQRLLDCQIDRRPVTALFSGDTIVHREHWGDRALSQCWGRLALHLINTHPQHELYWFLISQGYRTYRFLPLFFQAFYPRRDLTTPAHMQVVTDALARTLYPRDYDPTRGVIRATASQYRLRAGIADVTTARSRDPDVAFFARQNPGHARGDELCCLAPLTRDNFTAAAYRVIGEVATDAGVS